MDDEKDNTKTRWKEERMDYKKLGSSVIVLVSIFLVLSGMNLMVSAAENSVIHGYIIDADGGYISNATVSIYQWETGYENSTLSNSSGFYSMSVPTGEVLLEVYAEGYSPNPYSNLVYIDGDTEENVTLYCQNSVIRGKITADSDDGPLINDTEVTIYLDWCGDDGEYDFNSTSTGSGFYSINVASGEVYLQFYADGYSGNSTPQYSIGSNEVLWVNISLLSENSIIYGNITDGVTGKGIEDAEVTLYWTDNQGEGYWKDTHTDSSGYYELNVAAVDVNLSVEAEGYFTKHMEVGSIGVNESKEVNVSLYGLSKPSPADGATRVKIDADLSWTCTAPTGGITYDVYFGTTNPPPLVSPGQSSSKYNPGSLQYSTTYYWQIIAWNEEGERAEGPIWHFTTEKKPGGRSSPPPPPPPNQAPVADAGGPYHGFKNVPIAFDGSKSNDSDGTIVSYEWSFGDGGSETGVSPTHTYHEVGNYTVTLKVTDNGGKTGTATTYAVIVGKPNHPPATPVINGPTEGNVNVGYSYTAVSMDPDNDSLRYVFEWGDGTSNTTGFLPSGTSANVSHSWKTAGVYSIEVYVLDENNATSGTARLTVLVGICYADDLGYLVDSNGDGFYDLFHSNATGNETTVEQQHGDFLVDADGDGKWDYTFNSSVGLTPYEEKERQMETPGFETVVFILAVLAAACALRREIK